MNVFNPYDFAAPDFKDIMGLQNNDAKVRQRGQERVDRRQQPLFTFDFGQARDLKGDKVTPNGPGFLVPDRGITGKREYYVEKTNSGKKEIGVSYKELPFGLAPGVYSGSGITKGLSASPYIGRDEKTNTQRVNPEFAFQVGFKEVIDQSGKKTMEANYMKFKDFSILPTVFAPGMKNTSAQSERTKQDLIVMAQTNNFANPNFIKDSKAYVAEREQLKQTEKKLLPTILAPKADALKPVTLTFSGGGKVTFDPNAGGLFSGSQTTKPATVIKPTLVPSQGLFANPNFKVPSTSSNAIQRTTLMTTPVKASNVSSKGFVFDRQAAIARQNAIIQAKEEEANWWVAQANPILSQLGANAQFKVETVVSASYRGRSSGLPEFYVIPRLYQDDNRVWSAGLGGNIPRLISEGIPVTSPEGLVRDYYRRMGLIDFALANTDIRPDYDYNKPKPNTPTMEDWEDSVRSLSTRDIATRQAAWDPVGAYDEIIKALQAPWYNGRGLMVSKEQAVLLQRYGLYPQNSYDAQKKLAEAQSRKASAQAAYNALPSLQTYWSEDVGDLNKPAYSRWTQQWDVFPETAKYLDSLKAQANVTGELDPGNYGLQGKYRFAAKVERKAEEKKQRVNALYDIPVGAPGEVITSSNEIVQEWSDPFSFIGTKDEDIAKDEEYRDKLKTEIKTTEAKADVFENALAFLRKSTGNIQGAIDDFIGLKQKESDVSKAKLDTAFTFLGQTTYDPTLTAQDSIIKQKASQLDPFIYSSSYEKLIGNYETKLSAYVDVFNPAKPNTGLEPSATGSDYNAALAYATSQYGSGDKKVSPFVNFATQRSNMSVKELAYAYEGFSYDGLGKKLDVLLPDLSINGNSDHKRNTLLEAQKIKAQVQAEVNADAQAAMDRKIAALKEKGVDINDPDLEAAQFLSGLKDTFTKDGQVIANYNGGLNILQPEAFGNFFDPSLALYATQYSRLTAPKQNELVNKITQQKEKIAKLPSQTRSEEEEEVYMKATSVVDDYNKLIQQMNDATYEAQEGTKLTQVYGLWPMNSGGTKFKYGYQHFWVPNMVTKYKPEYFEAKAKFDELAPTIEKYISDKEIENEKPYSIVSAAMELDSFNKNLTNLENAENFFTNKLDYFTVDEKVVAKRNPQGYISILDQPLYDTYLSGVPTEFFYRPLDLTGLKIAPLEGLVPFVSENIYSNAGASLLNEAIPFAAKSYDITPLKKYVKPKETTWEKTGDSNIDAVEISSDLDAANPENISKWLSLPTSGFQYTKDFIEKLNNTDPTVDTYEGVLEGAKNPGNIQFDNPDTPEDELDTEVSAQQKTESARQQTSVRDFISQIESDESKIKELSPAAVGNIPILNEYKQQVGTVSPFDIIDESNLMLTSIGPADEDKNKTVPDLIKENKGVYYPTSYKYGDKSYYLKVKDPTKLSDESQLYLTTGSTQATADLITTKELIRKTLQDQEIARRDALNKSAILGGNVGSVAKRVAARTRAINNAMERRGMTPRRTSTTPITTPELGVTDSGQFAKF